MYGGGPSGPPLFFVRDGAPGRGIAIAALPVPV
jgi:hypothetical protein